MKRLAAVAVVVLVAIAAASVLRDDDEERRTLTLDVQEQARLHEGVGAVRVFSGTLPDDGRFDGECRVTSLRPEPRERCALTVTLGGGENEIQLAGVRRVAAPDVRLSVLGGSGEYAGADGEALLTGDRLELELDG